MALKPDAFDLSVQDTIMPVVPFFHANGWSIVSLAPMSGWQAGAAGHEAGWRSRL